MSEQNTFDKEAFASLLSSALKEHSLTQAEFADEVHLSKAYLNRFINKKNDRPPKSSTIHRMAQVLNDDALYGKLMEAAGLDPADALLEMIFTESKDELRQKKICNIVSSALFQCDPRLSWSPILGNDSADSPLDSRGFDLGVQVKDSEYIDNWYFEVKQFSVGKKMESAIKNYYSQLLYLDLEPKTKISIVVCSKNEFDSWLTITPSLPFYLSIVLVDEERGVVTNEKYVKTFLPLEDELTEIDVLVSRN